MAYPSDTLTVEILLELPEIWTLLHRAVGSHFAYTEAEHKHWQLCISNWLSMCVGGSTTPISMSYGRERKHTNKFNG